MYHYLPFFGGSYCQKSIPGGTGAVYLPPKLSGMCLWKKIKGKSAHEKTSFAIRKGAGGESPLEKCKAAYL